MTTTFRRRSLSDPLAVALAPPPGETQEERETRLKAEAEARRISDGIDDMIRQERNDRKRTKEATKVLLLGQSESGKSTTLKQFQLLHSPDSFHAERLAWRAVIYLNLVKSVRRIVEALSPEPNDFDDDDVDSTETASIIITSSGRPPSAISGTKVPNFERYRDQLEPLAALEDRLIRLLSSPDEDEPTHLPLNWDNSHVNSTTHAVHNGINGHNGHNGWSNGRNVPGIIIPQNRPPYSVPVTPLKGTSSANRPSNGGNSKTKEVVMSATTNWKKAFALGGKSKSPKSAHTGEVEGWWEDPDDPVHALNASASAMLELWRDPRVRQRLHEKRIRLEESSGFYLDEIPRITAKMYMPTDGMNRGVRWKIYDVGGARNQRMAWAPYFEDVNAIIFLAPISVFDQVLAEVIRLSRSSSSMLTLNIMSQDPRVNRLEDSLLLWKSVVSNKLLQKVSIVLFLNKCDLLQAKLEAGVRLNQHMISYSGSNDYASVSKCAFHSICERLDLNLM
ncbi:hypothetical protein ONZ45_g12975 [Pleurotus djamor]|nr:hypothetical protein ONZ45_g12975 [Pleurotus djamor]